MNKVQSNKLEMYKTVGTYLDSKTSVTETMPAFENLVTNFKNKVAEIEDLSKERETVKAGKTADKLTEENELVEALFKVMSAVNLHATLNGFNDLIEISDYAEYELKQGLRDDELVDKAYALYDEALKLKEDLAGYAITEADIESVKTNADEFAVAIGKAGAARAEGKQKTRSLKFLFDEADTILYNQIDRVADILKRNNPEFFNGYDNARMIVDN